MKTESGEEATAIEVVERYITAATRESRTPGIRETLCSLLADEVKNRESPGVVAGPPCANDDVLGSASDNLHLESREACNAGVFPKISEAWVVYALDDATPLPTDMKFVLSKRNGKWVIAQTAQRRGECDDPGYIAPR